jgi:hypothetical protein
MSCAPQSLSYADAMKLRDSRTPIIRDDALRAGVSLADDLLQNRQDLRSGTERIFGFDYLMPSGLARPSVLLEERDEDNASEHLSSKLPGKRFDFVGLYSMGAKRAASPGRLPNRLIFVGRDGTVLARKLLLHSDPCCDRTNAEPKAQSRSGVSPALARGELVSSEQEKDGSTVTRDSLP